MLNQTLIETSVRIDRVLRNRKVQLTGLEIGRLRSIENGIAQVSGLPTVKAMELLRFENGLMGMAFDLDPDEIGVVLLGSSSHLKSGSEVRLTGQVVDIPVGPGLLGRIINSLGEPLDNAGPIHTDTRWPIEQEAPEIIHRGPVTTPLETGIKIIDALIPIGRGQRQLILGDRQTGKTAIAVDTILNQQDKDVVCVYCSIGQRGSAVARVIQSLTEHNAISYCVVVAASGEDSAGLQFIAPYAATSIADYFMLNGRDVLIIYDDLTKHAHAYRELSLLLRRPPGREAYPGDIFYIHSRLLERSTHLNSDQGGGSLTALPIIETQAQNLSAYIPTNLISITDGQIYLSQDLFRKGELPAIDAGKSVSRVGGKAQLPAFLDIAGDLRLAYTQFKELETFARFGTRLDQQTQQTVDRGLRIREIFKQEEGKSLTAAEQVTVLLAANNGIFDEFQLEQIKQVEYRLCEATEKLCVPQCKKIESGELLNSNDKMRILEIAQTIVKQIRLKK